MTQVEAKKIAVPLAGKQFSTHFGQSTAFAVFEVDGAQRKIIGHEVLSLPGQHACGMAGWLKERGVQTVIVGGLGRGAVANLLAAGVNIVAGIAGSTPESLVQACLEGRLQSAVATCAGHAQGHGHQHGHEHGHGHSCQCQSQPTTK